MRAIRSKASERLHRQFGVLGRTVPPARHLTERLLQDGMRLVRIPVSVLLVLGGIFSFLPVLGIWMLPLGLMLLAVDLPALQSPVGASFIRARRRGSLFWRNRVRWRWRGSRPSPGQPSS